jgi:hypothetical protein
MEITMLLVTFHGGPSPGINNVYCYNTTTKANLTQQALTGIDPTKLSELRALIYCNGYLYVANGGKSSSNVLTFQHQSKAPSYQFNYVADFIDSTIVKGNFTTSIAHPFSLAFDGAGFAYVSNQDTNVVAQVGVSANFQTGTLASGCQSQYLMGLEKTLCPKGNCVFLDGTFVASQQGTLDHVSVAATNVSSQYGGLQVSPTSGKVQNSVRDVVFANGMLFVCDEPSLLVRIYALPNGNYLGASSPFPDKPTHLSVLNGGLYASASGALYWSPLPASSASPTLAFQKVLTATGSNTIGGISFNQSNAAATAYVCFQAGTGGAFGGSIETYSFTQGNAGTAPTFTNGATFASSPTDFKDTPEFVLYLPDTLT